MLRVIGGALRGRRLLAPEGRHTRPTAARVRQAIFDVITHHTTLGVDLRGARVADLYAGSGALGIEALSRGAILAVFVENDPRAASLLRRNLHDLQLEDRGEVCVQDVGKSHASLERQAPFDLLLLDPPYHLPRPRLHLSRNPQAGRNATVVADHDSEVDSLEAALAALNPAPLLAEHGLLVLERAAGSPPPSIHAFAPPVIRRWGHTEALFYRHGSHP